MLIISRLFIAFVTPVLFTSLLSAASVKTKYDGAAKALATQLVPLGLTPKGDAQGLGRVRAQIIKVLEAMESSEVKAGPGAEELLDTAYRYRPDVGATQRAAAVATLSAVWRDARAMGLFSDDHKFNDKITRGVDVGQSAIFEYIVPISLAPEFSQDVTNIRIAPPSKAHTTSSGVSERDSAYIKTLESVSREVAGMKKMAAIQNGGPRNILGQTPDQAQKLWKAEMERDGASASLKPSIILKGYLLASPQKHNGEAWHLQTKVTNLSPHATEVEVQCWAIGTTWKKHENFLMLEAKQKVPLRKGQEETVNFTTLAQNIYKGRGDDYENLDPKKERPRSRISYRGAIFRVVYGKDTVATTATDDNLVHLLEDDSAKSISSLPNFFVDPKAPKK